MIPRTASNIFIFFICCYDRICIYAKGTFAKLYYKVSHRLHIPTIKMRFSFSCNYFVTSQFDCLPHFKLVTENSNKFSIYFYAANSILKQNWKSKAFSCIWNAQKN